MPANRSRRGRKRNSQNMNIKLETAEMSTSEEETPTNIQKYLNSFNKEIQIVSDTSSQSSSSKSVQNRTETATETCFVTTTGEFFPRNNIELSEGRIVTVIEGDNEVSSNGNATDGSMGKKIITTITESSQLVLSDATYQTLTVVPSETETGELSYVLIVQNPEDEPVKKLKKECKEEEKDDDNDEQDLTVYDFDENEATNEAIESCEEEVKKKPGRPPSARKSQNVSQAHMCNYCNYTTSKRYLLSRHLKCHSEERPHKCSVCERGFKTVTALQNHVNTHTGTKPHACKCCDSRFTTSGELVRHVRYKHTHEKPHKCTMCDYASVELSKMRNHMRCHTGERPYQCPHCTYASPDSFKLKRHLRIHTGERPYVCLVCGHRFTQSNSLKAHSLVHCDSDKPIFRCDMCPATCGRKTDLRIHMQKLHTPDQLLTCRRCGKQFPDRYTFKVHIKSHDGEKCWKCEYCPYASVSHRHLISHMLVHTDQKPYSCNLCEQKFRQRQLLKRHQNLYHNPGYVPPVPKEKTHECSECKRSFRHKGNLIRHMSVHDPDSKLVQHATALKLGRQRKISVSNNPNLKILLNAADADEIKDEDDNSEETVVVSKNDLAKSLMSIEADDGQQYVVLEVIPYSGDNAQEDDDDDDNIITADEKLDMESEYIVPDTKINFTDKQDNRLTVDCSQISNKEKLNVISDLENCFGFGESDEEVDD